MSNRRPAPYPGRAWYEAWLAAAMLTGRTLTQVAADAGVPPTIARQSAIGHTMSARAQEIRRKMVDAVGEEQFLRCWDERLRQIGTVE